MALRSRSRHGRIVERLRASVRVSRCRLNATIDRPLPVVQLAGLAQASRLSQFATSSPRCSETRPAVAERLSTSSLLQGLAKRSHDASPAIADVLVEGFGRTSPGTNRRSGFAPAPFERLELRGRRVATMHPGRPTLVDRLPDRPARSLGRERACTDIIVLRRENANFRSIRSV